MSDLILINVTGRSVNAKYLPAQEPTAGWTGELQARFTFDASWAGASKTAVFIAGEESVPVHLADMTVDVPPEVLAVEGETLMVGVVGVWDDTTTRPTEVVPVVDITHGAYIPAEWRPTTPELYTQLLAAVAGYVRTVNYMSPDQHGNVDLGPVPWFGQLGYLTYDSVVAARQSDMYVYGISDAGDIYPLIWLGDYALFGGINPLTGQASYWKVSNVNGTSVTEFSSTNYAKSNTIDTSDSLPTCKAVYDELTKYYGKTAVDNAIAAAMAEAAQALSSHNADPLAHPAIRQTITELANRLNALADSDDATLDQLSEIVAYIKSNKDLIDAVTTSKVSISDIVNSLTSTATNKPLSAAQGAVLKAAVDALEAEVEASKVIVLDADNLPDNAYNVVAAAFPSNRLCLMRVSIANVKYLFLQDMMGGEDYFTFSAVGRDGKLIKRKLYRDNTLSDAEISDLSNVFVGDDDTTYSEWKTHIDAGQVCMWRSTMYAYLYTYQSTYASGTLAFCAIDHAHSHVLELSPSGTRTWLAYNIPFAPDLSQAGYVWTATATGTADWLPPTGGSGGDSNTVVFDEASVTYDAVAAAVNAGKAVHLWKTDGNGDKVLMTLVRPPLADNSEMGYFFASGVVDNLEVGAPVVHTAILPPAGAVSYDTQVIASTDYVGFVFQTLAGNVEEAITAATNEVKLAVILFGENKLYLADADAETQIELTFDVVTQIVTTRPTIVIDNTNSTVYTFDKVGVDSASIVFSRTDGNTTSTITMAADNTVTVAETNNGGSPPVLDFDGNHLYKDGEQLTYAVLKELVASRPDTIVKQYSGSIYILNVDDSNEDTGYISFARQEVGNDKTLHTTITMSSDGNIRLAQSISNGIPTPTESDNGKALVAQDGAAVWKEIAGGGDKPWRLLDTYTTTESDIMDDWWGREYSVEGIREVFVVCSPYQGKGYLYCKCHHDAPWGWVQFWPTTGKAVQFKITLTEDYSLLFEHGIRQDGHLGYVANASNIGGLINKIILGTSSGISAAGMVCSIYVR